ncbi:MAG TPA: gluconate 2-dehydrogenase subunit 3 family protein [Gemmatimonadales bacterium]|nr:gluconate 2-dehydrogenase subunit 3 family protein [Gemmatimonadales bacterium]
MTSNTPEAIDRREAIKRVTLLLGGVALSGSGLVAACERAQRGAAGAGKGGPVGSFSAQEVALLDEVADTILPDTKTPGAKAAHVGAFMALMVTDSYTDRDAGVFRDGLRTLEQSGFMAKTPEQRLAQLEQLDKEQIDYQDKKQREDPPHFFRQMKDLTLLGYFTSEIGGSQAMRYRETPGRFDPCVPYTPGETTWSGHA